jgi:ATP adenylyltransferase
MPDDRPTSTGPESLHAPWRLKYLEGVDAAEKASGPPKAGSGSFLLDYWLDPASDAKNQVIVRIPDGGTQTRARASARAAGLGSTWSGPGGMILLNKYPYANGHLLVALGVARGRLVDYTDSERASFWRLVDLAAMLMEEALQPQGINLGINQGRAAGAGVPQHLHAHLVPRWNGDVNYMTAIGGVRVIPAALEAMGMRYREAWAKLAG